MSPGPFRMFDSGNRIRERTATPAGFGMGSVSRHTADDIVLRNGGS